MRQGILAAIALAGACCLVFGQSTHARPAFVAAEIHPSRAEDWRLWTSSLRYPNSSLRPLVVNDGLLQLRGVTMLDVIAAAYGWAPHQIAGGPNWLELDHFDITAKVPNDSSLEDRKLMLQSLLEDRFKLSVRKGTAPILGYVLLAGKQPTLKRATGSEKSGCIPYASSTPTQMDVTENEYGPNPVHYTLGSGSTVTYSCRNITMDAFMRGLQNMVGVYLSPGAVLDATGLKGAWNFDLHWTNQFVHLDRLPMGHVTVFDALDQQLGLKLEERPVVAPALVVVNVSRTPAVSPSDTAKITPRFPPPTLFEVASIKPVDPRSPGRQNRKIEPRRLTIENFPMRYLFDMALPMQKIERMPDWAEFVAFNIEATVPPGFASLTTTNLAPPMLALLRDRFRLAYHTEQRPEPAYVIQVVKPKMTQADPTRRPSCSRDTAPSGAQGFLERLTCQNITMTEFSDWFARNAIGLQFGPINDGTGLSGRWDFALVYDSMDRPGSGVTPASDRAGDTVSDPRGGYTIFEAMQHQLGLKLVTTTKPRPVIVIDRLEKKPTEQ